MVSSRRDFVWCATGILVTGSSVARMLMAQELSTPGQLSGAGIAKKIEALKPGEYLWAPAIAPAGPVLAIVSLPVQRMYVYRNGLLIAVTTVSTGTKGRETPPVCSPYCRRRCVIIPTCITRRRCLTCSG
jgi:hypothetical protein